MPSLGNTYASRVRVSANVIFSRDNKVFLGWVDAPVNIN